MDSGVDSGVGFENVDFSLVFQWFLASAKSQHEASWRGVWGRLGASWPLLGPPWASWARSWGRLGSVLGPLGKAYEKNIENIFKKEPT